MPEDRRRPFFVSTHRAHCSQHHLSPASSPDIAFERNAHEMRTDCMGLRWAGHFGSYGEGTVNPESSLARREDAFLIQKWSVIMTSRLRICHSVVEPWLSVVICSVCSWSKRPLYTQTQGGGFWITGKELGTLLRLVCQHWPKVSIRTGHVVLLCLF